MVTIRFYESAEGHDIMFAVIAARSGGKWVMCRHRARTTLEIPGGHLERGETAEEAARRELYEETGAVDYELKEAFVYSVQSPELHGGMETFGMLYTAEIYSFEPELHSEIEGIVLLDELPHNWTYPDIQPQLIAEAVRQGLL